MSACGRGSAHVLKQHSIHTVFCEHYYAVFFFGFSIVLLEGFLSFAPCLPCSGVPLFSSSAALLFAFAFAFAFAPLCLHAVM